MALVIAASNRDPWSHGQVLTHHAYVGVRTWSPRFWCVIPGNDEQSGHYLFAFYFVSFLRFSHFR